MNIGHCVILIHQYFIISCQDVLKVCLDSVGNQLYPKELQRCPYCDMYRIIRLFFLNMYLERCQIILQCPSMNTKSFRHPYNIYNVKTTSSTDVKTTSCTYWGGIFMCIACEMTTYCVWSDKQFSSVYQIYYTTNQPTRDKEPYL